MRQCDFAIQQLYTKSKKITLINSTNQEYLCRQDMAPKIALEQPNRTKNARTHTQTLWARSEF